MTRIGVCLALLFVLYHANLREEGSPSDTMPLKLLDISIIQGHGFDIGEVLHQVQVREDIHDYWMTFKPGSPGYRLDRTPYTAFPFLPVYAAYLAVGGKLTLYSVNALAKFCSVLAALAALYFLHRVALNLKAPPAAALLGVATFGVATTLWNSVSQGFWTSTGFFPFFAAGLAIATAPKLTRTKVAFAAACWGYAIACRQQEGPMMVPFFLYLWRRAPRELLAVAIPSAAIVALSLFTNHYQTGSWLGAYGSGSTAARIQIERSGGSVGLGANWLNGLGGILLSPGRGLFFFCPVLLLPLLWLRNLPAKERAKGLTLSKACLIAIAIEFLLVGKYSYWWGGWSWGPRILAPIVPAFFPLFVLGLPRKLSVATRTAIAACFAWGALTQGLGAFKYHMYLWNASPVDVDAAPERVWDWKDNPLRRAWNEPYYAEAIGIAYSLEF